MIEFLTQDNVKRLHAKNITIIQDRRGQRKKELMKEMDKVLTINGVKYYREDLL